MLINLRNALMMGGPEPAPAYWGLCFTAEEPNVVVNMIKGDSGFLPPITLETSRDGSTWIPFDDAGASPVTLVNIGDHVYFRAGNGGNKAISGDIESRSFTISGLCAASGNINSILDADNQDVAFKEPNIFAYLFYNCTSLTTAPMLPTTTLTNGCYESMFYGCTSLTSAPELPATTLQRYCYRYMFRGCSSMNSVAVNFAAWSPTNAVGNWLNGVSTTGTFYCPTALGTDSTITRGVSRCPGSWTVINTD